MRALDAAGVLPRLAPLLVRMPGRLLHLADGSTTFTAYGLPGETNHSVSRVDLTRCLIEAAGNEPRITLHFRKRCLGLTSAGQVQMVDEDDDRQYQLDAARIIGADGAGSALRKALAQAGHIEASNQLLDHDYRELTIPPVAGRSGLAVREALHIWPRHGYMLIALPNADCSFTATLFLPREGTRSFASLAQPGAARRFFAREFPDALAVMPQFEHEFATHRQGILGTVRCAPWQP
jgi:kynurenine 3-monooxygenase